MVNDAENTFYNGLNRLLSVVMTDNAIRSEVATKIAYIKGF